MIFCRIYKKLLHIYHLQVHLMSAVSDLSSIVAGLKVSVDALVAKQAPGDDPAVVQAVSDLTALKAEVDAVLSPPAS